MITQARYRELAQLLNCARSKLAQNRWIQGRPVTVTKTRTGRESYGYCVYGALAACVFDNPLVYHTSPFDRTKHDLMQQAVEFLEKIVQTDLVDWNDSSKRKKKEVIDLLIKAEMMATQLGQRRTKVSSG